MEARAGRARQARLSEPVTVLTAGHSTRALDELVALLEAAGVRTLVDVRRYPGSRRHPWFAREPLAVALAERGIEYRHEPDLGGRRAPRPGSPHTALRNASFRAYADHMESAAFREALGRVVELAGRAPTCVMCAEAHPSRCHRRLIADALLARGARVLHLLEPGRAQEHVLAPEARVVDGRPRYDRD